MSDSISTNPKQTEPERPRIAWLLFALIGFVVVLADAYDGTLAYADLDDRMRALQIRELVQTGNLFDLMLSFMALPEPYLSHYSRLVDLPYALITWTADPVVGSNLAAWIAFHVWPVVMLALFLRLAYATMFRVSEQEPPIGQAVLVVVLLAVAILEFSPGRIDHHNMQLLLMMAMIYGLVRADPRGGLLAGVSAALSIAVGLECIPYIATGLAALSIAAIANPDRYRRQLFAVGAGFGLAALPAGYASLGLPGVVAPSCDAIGAPWISIMIVSGAILAIAPAYWPRWRNTKGVSAMALRFASLAVPAFVGGAAVLAIFPECAGDPYANVQGLARTLWFDRIDQEKPLTAIFAQGSVAVAVICGAFGFIIVAAFAQIATHQGRNENHGPAILLAVAAVSYAFIFVFFRSVQFMAAFVPLLLPLAYGLRNRAFPQAGKPDPNTRWPLFAAAAIPVILIGVVFIVGRAPQTKLTVFDQMLLDECKGQEMAQLDLIEPGIVLASYALSFRIAEEFPQHKIAAVPLHRAAPGIERLLVAYTETDVEKRSSALAAYDYLAVCARDLGASDMDKTPLFAALVGGERIDGLEPVGSSPESVFRLYRIDQTELR